MLAYRPTAITSATRAFTRSTAPLSLLHKPSPLLLPPHRLLSAVSTLPSLTLRCPVLRTSLTLSTPCTSHHQRGSHHNSRSSDSRAPPSSRWSPLGLSTLLLATSSLLLLPSSSSPSPAHAETISIPPIPIFFDPLPSPLKLHLPDSLWTRFTSTISFTLRTLLRLPVLLFLWTPLLLTYPLLPSSYWYPYCKRVLEWSGPVFVKFGQWASTRPDVFSEEFVGALQSLQSAVHSHPYRYTLDVIRRTFGEAALHRLVVDKELVGSGSMAQVHHGRVLGADGKTVEVAVKVLHPSTPSRIETDLFLMSCGAKLLHMLPGNEFLSLPETIEQFSSLLKQHTDLTSEANNLDRFRQHFARFDNIHFPAPVWSFVSDKILVEELEGGVPLNEFMRRAPPVTHTTVTFPGSPNAPAASSTSSLSPFYNLPSVVSTSLEPSSSEIAGGEANMTTTGGVEGGKLMEANRLLARLGMKMFMKMMVDDNFIHSDLHPGNLLVNVKDEYRRLHPSPAPLTIEYLLTLPTSALSLTVLDTALVTTLNERNRKNFLALFGALVEGDGRLAARLMRDNAREQHVTNEEEFESEMDALVKQVPALNTKAVDIGVLLQQCLAIVRKHRVKIESDFASLVMALIVVEGVGRKLDPQMSLVKESVPILVANSQARRILWEELGLSMFNPTLLKATLKAAWA